MLRFCNLFIICFLLGLPMVRAQNVIQGYVIDAESQDSLPGAHVYFQDLKKGSATDLNGKFRVEDLPKGMFLVEVRHIGYTVLIKKISIESDVLLNFYIEPSHKELNEVIVTGVSAATSRLLNPVPTLAVNHQELHQHATFGIVDALSKKPGIAQISTGATISKPVIRGLGFNRVVVLHNTIRQEGQQWGDEHGVEVDEYSIDRVEIIKGPGSLTYGSDAMAGVIHLLNPKLPTEGIIQTRWQSGYHTNNRMAGMSILNMGKINDLYWLIQGSAKKAGNYRNTLDGWVYNSGFDEHNIKTVLGTHRKSGFIELQVSSFNQTLGLVEGERDSSGNFKYDFINESDEVVSAVADEDKLKSFTIYNPKQQIAHHQISLHGKYFFGTSLLSSTIAFQRNHRQEFELSGHHGIHDEAAIGLDLKTINYELIYKLPSLRLWESTIGVNGYSQQNKIRGEEFLIPEYHLTDAGIFYHTNKDFEKISLAGGLRWNTRRLQSNALLLNQAGVVCTNSDTTCEEKFSSIERNFTALASSIGISYLLSKQSVLKYNISNGFRTPNIAELASNGVHEGTLRYEIGDRNLLSEYSIQNDLSFAHDSKHISAEAGLFYNAIRNYIYSRKLRSQLGGDSLLTDEGETVAVFRYEQGNAQLYGAELMIDIHPHPFDWLHFENSVAWVSGELLHQSDSSRYLPFIPAAKFTSELRAQFDFSFNYFNNVFAYIEYEHYFRQNKVFVAYNTERENDAYGLLSAGIGFDITNKQGKSRIQLMIAASNLMDVGYQNHLSRLKYASQNPATGRIGVFNMGRNFNIKLIVPFETMVSNKKKKE